MDKVSSALEEWDIRQFKESLSACKAVFRQKVQDYGAAFRILHPHSITDILYIKVCRIRSVESKGVQRVQDPIALDYVSLVNYSLMALIQLRHGVAKAPMEAAALPWKVLSPMYEAEIHKVWHLLTAKNHDYDAAWKQMDRRSIHDILLMRLLRLKQMEANQTQVPTSDDYAENYQDMINYTLFCMAKLAANESPPAPKGTPSG